MELSRISAIAPVVPNKGPWRKIVPSRRGRYTHARISACRPSSTHRQFEYAFNILIIVSLTRLSWQSWGTMRNRACEANPYQHPKGVHFGAIAVNTPQAGIDPVACHVQTQKQDNSESNPPPKSPLRLNWRSNHWANRVCLLLFSGACQTSTPCKKSAKDWNAWWRLLFQQQDEEIWSWFDVDSGLRKVASKAGQRTSSSML